MASRRRWSWRRWPIAVYDRIYRWVNGLDRPGSRVGSVLRVTARRSRRAVRLADGVVVRRGDLIGIVHLDNERVAALQSAGLTPEATGLEFRRRFLASLGELARLTEPGGPLSGLAACTATTILHRSLGRLGFAPALGDTGGSRLAGAYQRALLGSLRPGARTGLSAAGRLRARQLWISREALCARFRRSARDVSEAKPVSR